MIKIDWLNQEKVHLYGLPFLNDKKNLNRFNLDFKKKLNEQNKNLLDLGEHLSGTHFMFKSNTKTLKISVELKRDNVHPHMSNLAESGLDIYVFNQKQWVFYQSIKPRPCEKVYEQSINFKSKKDNVFMIYLPLYNSIIKMDIYIDNDAYIKPYQHPYEKRGCIYGTSITQGACASRPGMTYTSLISRMLNHEIINYGFSGNGLGEDVVAKNIAAMNDLDYLIIDYEANAGALNLIEKTLKNFIDTIRKQYHEMPIFIISRVTTALSKWDCDIEKRRLKNKRYQIKFVDQAKDKNLYFIDGKFLLPEPNHDMTVDGVHFNDIGFLNFAENLSSKLIEVFNERRF